MSREIKSAIFQKMFDMIHEIKVGPVPTCVLTDNMRGLNWFCGASPAIEVSEEMSAARPVCDAGGTQELLTGLTEVRGEVQDHEDTFSRAEECVRFLSRRVQTIPAADVIALENGIQIIWRNQDRHIWLLFAFSGAAGDSIYKAITANRRLQSSTLIHRIAVDSLAELLGWLQEPQSAVA